MKAALPEKPWLPKTVLLGCTKTRPCSCVKYLIILASGSSSTAPDTELMNFLSGNWMRAICGLKADAVSARSMTLLALPGACRPALASCCVMMPISPSAV